MKTHGLMNDKLKEEVKNKILQVLNGYKLETNKFELKVKWYDLSWKNNANARNKDYYEFLKDCTSIANSYGGEDGFIIIGVDQGNCALRNTDINDSGKDDSAKIKDLLNSNVTSGLTIDIDYVEVNGHKISVIYIPPSTEKPHVILEYYSPAGQNFKNEIFTRKGSSATIADKYDIDKMYWERSNITIDRKINVSFNIANIKIEFSNYFPNTAQYPYIDITAVLENSGTRALAICKIVLVLEIEGELHNFINTRFVSETLVIHPGNIMSLSLHFKFIHEQVKHDQMHNGFYKGIYNSKINGKNWKVINSKILLTDGVVIEAIPKTTSEDDNNIDHALIESW